MGEGDCKAGYVRVDLGSGVVVVVGAVIDDVVDYVGESGEAIVALEVVDDVAVHNDSVVVEVYDVDTAHNVIQRIPNQHSMGV